MGPPHSFAAQSASVLQQEIAALAELPRVRAAIEWFRDQEPRFAEWQLQASRIPAPPFGEDARAAWLEAQFQSLRLARVYRDGVGNVLALRPGLEQGPVSLSAHLDTVFPSATPLNIRQQGRRLYGPGISDNAAGLVALLAVAAACQEFSFSHTAPLLFIGNVGEEGEGDLRGMRQVFFHSEWKDSIRASVILDGAGSDTVVSEALGSRRFEIVIRGPGGHSWSDFGAPHPILAMARAIHLFSQTRLSSSPKTTFNVGVISGGTSVNSIPESASMRVDIRSTTAMEIERLEFELRRSVEQAVEGEVSRSERNNPSPHPTLKAEIRTIGNRPAGALEPNARILHIARAVDAYLGNTAQIRRASTDANIPISLGRDAIALGGGGSGGGAHTLQEWFDPRGRELGLARILLIVLALTGVSGRGVGSLSSSS
ncbi:MAG: M20/M25/M40 family metallo-hydrolase [Acidobacteria bacterium]|nr:M20/M25/M40 family metallo-hydrolase [Acidobacteriota bacterium]